jgi:hypothetical protein
VCPNHAATIAMGTFWRCMSVAQVWPLAQFRQFAVLAVAWTLGDVRARVSAPYANWYAN